MQRQSFPIGGRQYPENVRAELLLALEDVIPFWADAPAADDDDDDAPGDARSGCGGDGRCFDDATATGWMNRTSSLSCEGSEDIPPLGDNIPSAFYQEKKGVF